MEFSCHSAHWVCIFIDSSMNYTSLYSNPTANKELCQVENITVEEWEALLYQNPTVNIEVWKVHL